MSLVVYSQTPVDRSALKAHLLRMLEPLGHMSAVIRSGDRVLIKPNFVAPFFHAVTRFELLEAIISIVKDCGGKPILGESSGFEFDTETTFKILGVHDFARKIQVPLINFDKTEFVPIRLEKGFSKKVEIPRIVFESDVIINVPKLKQHNLTKATIGIKNLFGFLSLNSRRRIHVLGLEKSIHALAKAIKIDLVVVDGSVITSRAVFGSRKRVDLIAVSRNIYAADVFCCPYLGLNHNDVEHIRLTVAEDPDNAQFDIVKIEDGGKKKNTRFNSATKRIAPSHETFGKRLHRFAYRVIYFIDLIYSNMSRRGSLLPKIHYYFGIRPYIEKKQCNLCGECVPICPVNAIRLPEKKIDGKSCMIVRCLKCISACPEKAISIKGREKDESIYSIADEKR